MANHYSIYGEKIGRQTIAVLLVIIIISSGCLSNEGNEKSDIEPVEDSIPETNPESEKENEVGEEIIVIPESVHCDDTNTHHCMLPFPSGAFLSEDSSEITGYSLSIDGEAIPDTSSAESGNMLILDRLDGFSPSTQIFTTFESTPEIAGMASQSNISPSIENAIKCLSTHENKIIKQK